MPVSYLHINSPHCDSQGSRNDPTSSTEGGIKAKTRYHRKVTVSDRGVMCFNCFSMLDHAI